MDKSTFKSAIKQPLFSCFLNLKDPRVGGRCLHPLMTIIGITLCALICGADTWKAIELFGKKRKRWLSQYFDLSSGVPSHYTIARVFSLLEPKDVQSCFQQWVSLICQLVADDIINIDGKTLCGSSHVRGDKKAAHIVNAFAARQKITLGEIKTPDKTNEIKAIPPLLNMLDTEGMIITIDAMGTQKGIAKLIREKKAHYVLSLKENHKRFYKKVDRLFSRADELKFNAMVYHRWEDMSYGHGRIEEREYTVLPMMYLPFFKKEWKDLNLFIRVKSKRHLGGKTEESVRYFISSVPWKKYHKAAQAIRQHWGIENALHWKLDVGLHEDQCPIFRGFAAENLATMRKIVLYLLQSDDNSDDGIAMKRLKAALDCKYLKKVVGF